VAELDCTNPVCKQNKQQAVKYCLNTIDWFWHYGQVMTDEDRKKLATAVKELCEHHDPLRTATEIGELMARNEVEVVVKSKHKEIPYNPVWPAGGK